MSYNYLKKEMNFCERNVRRLRNTLMKKRLIILYSQIMSVKILYLNGIGHK
jgi:hypothetical protein